MNKPRIAAVLAIILTCLTTQAGDFYFEFSNGVGAGQGPRKLNLFPENSPWLGPNGVIVRDPISQTLAPNGRTTVSNLAGGDWRSEFEGITWDGRKVVTTNWWRFPQTNGLQYATNFTRTALPRTSAVSWLFTPETLRFRDNLTATTNGGVVYVDAAGGSATNTFAVVAGTNVTVATNGSTYTINASGGSVPANVLTNNATGVTLSGTFSGSLSGTATSADGAGALLSGPLAHDNRAVEVDAASNIVAATGFRYLGNGGGLTNLDGSKIQAGTISSNALDAATKAQLALAGSGTSTQSLATYTANGLLSSNDFISLRSYQVVPAQCPLPPMGWCSWGYGVAGADSNHCVMAMTNYAKNGMRDAGYTVMQIDEGWALTTRDASGNLQADSALFPGGNLRAFTDYVHANGFKVGIWCQWPTGNNPDSTHRPSMASYEYQDATNFAYWGFDMLKYDIPGQAATTMQRVDELVAKGLRESAQPVILKTSYGSRDGVPLPYMPRTINLMCLGDEGAYGSVHWPSADVWHQRYNASLVYQDWITKYYKGLQGPGCFVDPDYLATTGAPTNLLRSEFGMKCLMSSPLFIVAAQPAAGELLVLTNRELIAIDQDAACIIPTLVYSNDLGLVYTKPLGSASGKDGWAVALQNRKTNTTQSLTIYWTNIFYPSNQTMLVRDCWRQANAATNTIGYTVTVAANDTEIIRIAPYVEASGGVTLAQLQGATNTATLGAQGVLTNNQTGAVLNSLTNTGTLTLSNGTITRLSVTNGLLNLTDASGAASDVQAGRFFASSGGPPYGGFNGDGSGLTNLNASELRSGTVPLAALPSGVLTNGQSTATTFSNNIASTGTMTTGGTLKTVSGVNLTLTAGGGIMVFNNNNGSLSWSWENYDLAPSASGQLHLGKSSARWGTLWVTNVNASGPISFATNATVRAGVLGQCVMSAVGGTNYWVHDIGGGNWQTNHVP